MEFILVVLAIGFCVYYIIRHPIKSSKLVLALVGLFILGAVVSAAAIIGLIHYGSL